MNELRSLVAKVEELEYSNNHKCIELLDNRLQDLIRYFSDAPASGELLELKNCSWVLHERYYMEDEERLKWTFHHTRHRILKNATLLLKKMQPELLNEMQNVQLLSAHRQVIFNKYFMW